MTAVGEYELRGVHVAFPFEPYPSQLVFMDRVIEALQAPHRNALLESPTGTGKTLCLLCASLAWRQMHKAQRQVDQLGLAPVTAQGAAMLKQLAAGAGGGEREWLGGRAVAPEAPAQFGMAPAVACRIIYVSRTHGQLSQVVRELRNTTYRPNVSILGSRQQYCVHHDVKKVPGGQRQNAQCQKLVATQSCQFHRNVVDHKYQHKEVLTDALDIEDLVKHGEKHKVCPYYLTRDTANDADVIFMPYNYLTDPASRKSLAHLWKDSIVIFDEAHNMESICSEAASFDLTHTDIAMCVTEVDRCTSIKESGIEFTTTEPATQEELSILKIILRSFEDALAALPLKGSPASATFPGCKIYELFETAGVKHDNATELFAMVSKTTSMLAEAQGAGIQANPSLKKFSDALEAVFKASDMANCNRLYKMHITEEPERKGKRAGPQSITDLQPTLMLKPGQKPRQIGYWCFSAGVTMKEILDQGVRNVVLASGTLSPMSSWATEMQMNFEVKLENKHVIREDQLLAAVVRKGPSGVTLNSSYKNRENVQCVDDLGNLIVNVCRIVPANSGVLVFFPSYAALTAGTERWKQGSVWDRISKQKQIFIEPRESGSFKMTICAYTDEVDRAGSNGAVLMAVCRGKMSEGIDFADRHGRAVIVTGIPFPAALDPRVVLKRAFMDELMPEARAEGREAVSGEQWYTQQAARAVNQAIGRVIRHRNDYGVILLCDERFANWTKQAKFLGKVKCPGHLCCKFIVY
jgi:regulator of telomere elongation helicase 1